jgi:hypothetical protein
MKSTLKIICLFFTFSTLAGSDHGHGHSHSHGHSHGHVHKSNQKKVYKAVSKEKALEIGKFHVQRLIADKKIATSWNTSKFDKIVKKKSKKSHEWLITFSNEKETKDKKLFIFLTLSGDFVAANFTGK